MSQFGGAQWLAVVHWAMKTNNRECATYLFFASCAACKRVETYQPTSAFPPLVFAMLLARMHAHDASLRQAGFAQTYSRHSRTKPSVSTQVCFRSPCGQAFVDRRCPGTAGGHLSTHKCIRFPPPFAPSARSRSVRAIGQHLQLVGANNV